MQVRQLPAAPLEGKDQAPMTDPTAVMICGHGSRSNAAVEEFNQLARHVRRRLPD